MHTWSSLYFKLKWDSSENKACFHIAHHIVHWKAHSLSFCWSKGIQCKEVSMKQIWSKSGQTQFQACYSAVPLFYDEAEQSAIAMRTDVCISQCSQQFMILCQIFLSFWFSSNYCVHICITVVTWSPHDQ